MALSGSKLLTADNIKALSLALLFFVYSILSLSTAQVQYLETQHRFTVRGVFDQNLFGSTIADVMAAVGFTFLFVGLSFRSLRAKWVMGVSFIAIVLSLLLIGVEFAPIVGLATLPSLLGLLAAAYLLRIRAINKRTKVTAQAQTAASRRKSVESTDCQKTLPASMSEEATWYLGFRVDAKKVAIAFLLIIIIIAAGALLKWVSLPLFPLSSGALAEFYDENDPTWKFAILESALFNTFSLLSPIMIALVAFSFLYLWFLPRDTFKRVMKRFIGGGSQDFTQRATEQATSSQGTGLSAATADTMQAHGKTAEEGPHHEQSASLVTAFRTKRRRSYRLFEWMILCAALIVAPLLTIYPHLSGINVTGIGVSTDERYYVNWLSELRTESAGQGPLSAIANLFQIVGGDRPLTLMLIMTLSDLLGQPDLMVIRFLPAALAPMLVISVYTFVKFSLKTKEEESSSGMIAAIAGLFTAMSVQVVVGVYAGFLANWLALVPAYIALCFLIKCWDSKNRRQAAIYGAILAAIMILVLLIHLYTWANLLAVIVLFCPISYAFSRKQVTSPKAKVLILLLVVGTTMLIDYTKATSFATPSALNSESALIKNVQESPDSSSIWEPLYYTLGTNVGGFLSNPVLFILALIWVVRANITKGLDRVHLSMFFLASLPIAFGEVAFQTRVLYNIPFQIPALLAALYGISNIKDRTFSAILILAITLTLATFALRSMANLYLQLPE